ncbi:hypothetical protein [Saccharopolyspora pogona]|uniref:hypothetical protein n=1 Tax=Saccharopolyspora pogona TaxID=333966 RepID=UPI001682DFBB|nr:hypothetical protein [Saccharopolyspora pogona]
MRKGLFTRGRASRTAVNTAVVVMSVAVGTTAAVTHAPGQSASDAALDWYDTTTETVNAADIPASAQVTKNRTLTSPGSRRPAPCAPSSA